LLLADAHLRVKEGSVLGLGVRALRLFPLVILPLLAGCGATSGGLATVSSVAVQSRPAAGGFAGLLASSVNLGPAKPTGRASFLLTLRDPGAAKRNAEIAAMYDPSSPQFGHFASKAQLNHLGPSRAVADRVLRFLRRRGLDATWTPGDTWVSISGTVSVLHRTFGVSVRRYRAPSGGIYEASATDPRIPAALRHDVSGSSHLATAVWQRGHTVPSGGMSPSDISKAYDISPLRSQHVDGSGETVTFFEIDGFRQKDLDAYTKKFGLSAIKPVLKGPALQPQGEAEMDIEVVHAIAPGAKIVVYDENQNAVANSVNSQSAFEDKLVGYQRTIVNANKNSIISNSVGGCANVLGKGVATTLESIYARADALGEAWFAASGDSGAYDCLQNLEKSGSPPAKRDIGVDIPSSEPGVTGVGGTRIGVNGNGTWHNEVTWEGPVETSGGGGGVSTYFGRPSWQKAPGTSNTQVNPHNMRSVPDVSAIADPASSGTYYIDGQMTQEGGTSQAAPIWAAIMALADQYLRTHGGHRLGFANPALYALARSSQPYPPFHDVTVGNNLLYSATKGYDMATGLGTPDAWNLTRDLLRYEHGGGR
jgi:kumamolisin